MHRTVVLLITLVLVLPTLSLAASSSVPLAQTVYGQGPELHLLPDYGNMGARIQVYGLGYRPGARVRILYGAPGAEYMPRPLAVVVASPQGSFHTSFTVTCALWNFRPNPPKTCSLGRVNPVRLVVIGGFANGHFDHKKTASLGFIVTSEMG